MATKYKEYVEKMLKHNKELFDKFKIIHDEYVLNEHKMQEKFNEIGKEAILIVREYEDRLCRQSEIGGYGSYAGKLAEKFNLEIKKTFPMIDSVGIIKTTVAPEPVVEEPEMFTLKKINL